MKVPRVAAVGSVGVWVLGVDLGTTFTAAAAWRDGRAQILSLGTHTAAIPSVVLFRDDGSTMFGDAAELRSVTEPEHVAREFKRRVGDTTPLLVGGAPRSPESVMAVLLRAVVDASIQLEGSPPDRIAITHPASWGEYKLDVLRQAIRLAELGVDTVLVPEPVAAAVHYSTLQRVELHDFVAVYDLGGGTFDAAVVRRTEAGFDLYGQPEGIERLGGIDVDAAVFSHVQTALGLQLDTLDRDDPAVMSAFARLRADCVAAKEALSADTDAVIPVMLPGLATEVRITRSELETMIRPAIRDTIAALRRAITSGKLVPEHLARVLLVGGSSRIPLVAEMVNAELGRPIALDTHPKHAVALGAALVAAPEPAPAAPPWPVYEAPPPAPPPLPPPQSATTNRRSPAIVAVIIVAVLALGGIGYAVTQSGGSSSSSSSSDSSSLTPEEQATSVVRQVATISFTLDPSTVDGLQDQLRPFLTGSALSDVDSSASVLVDSVKSSGLRSTVSDVRVTTRSFDGQQGVFLVEIDGDFASDSSSTSATIRALITVTNVDGTFKVVDLVNCSNLNTDSTDSSSSC